jgi:hypothetical protein
VAEKLATFVAAVVVTTEACGAKCPKSPVVAVTVTNIAHEPKNVVFELTVIH